MEKADFYDILSISKNATSAEIKKAYRRLAMKYHPDRSTGDTEVSEQKFKEAKQAYDVLSDDRKRAAYDQFGHAAVDPSMAGDNTHHGGGIDDIFESVFGDVFGGGKQRVRRGADIRYDLDLSLEEAITGTNIKIRVPKLVNCKQCRGSGAKKGSTPVNCSTCGGHGQVRMQQGFFSLQQTCPKCRGKGSVIKDPCRHCNGHGRVRDTKTISTKIPAGVNSGDRIRLSGEGEVARNTGHPGDLYIHINVRKHDIFVRDGNDLYCDVPINYVTAALGGELEVPTLSGRVKLTVTPGTQSGKLFRLRGKGVRSLQSSSKGDLLCRTIVETPINLTSKQKELLHELGETMGENHKKHSPLLSSWLSGVKKFFDNIAA